MLCFWRSVVPDSCRCGLQDLFEVEQGLRTREPWLGYPGLAARCNVQHPDWDLQNPTSRDVFQAAVRHPVAPSYETGMHPHCPAVPRMPRIADFTDVGNMGVVLLSCITENATTKARATFCYSHVARCRRRIAGPRSAVTNASAVFSSTTTERPHEFFDYMGCPPRWRRSCWRSDRSSTDIRMRKNAASWFPTADTC